MSGAPILFLVIGKPTEDNEKQLILSRLSQELKTWNEHLSGCKLQTELENLFQSDTKKSFGGQKELVLSSDKLFLVVLFNPSLSGFKHFAKQYLAVKSCYRQLVYSGPALSECGSWLLQDGLLQFGELARILKDLEMPDFEPFYVNAFGVGKWTQDNIEKLTSLCIKLNPEEQKGSAGNQKLLEVLSSFFDEEIILPNHYDEKEKFSVSCFQSPNQNSSLIRIGDFKMFVNADSTKLPAEVYKGSDLFLMMTSDIRSYKWLQSSFDTDVNFHFGMLYSNALGSISQKAPEASDSKEKGLLVNISDTLKLLTRSLNDANIPVQSCFSSNNVQPTTIYHKAGFGTLQLYPLTPSADAKEVRELQKSQSNENVVSNFPSTSCVLLWQPFNKKQAPIRLFFTGFVPQQSLFEGLVKMRNVQCFSSWEGLSLLESMNKINKLKSKLTQEKTGSGLVNGNAQKVRDAAKAAAAKQKAADSSSATSHSAQGDGNTTFTKSQPKPKTTKNEVKTQVTSLPRQDKTEMKSANLSTLSTPGKTETVKQPSCKTRHSMGPLPTRSTLKTKEANAKLSTVAGPPKPQISTAKQVLPSKPNAPKPTKEVKPTSKPAPITKARPPKATSGQLKKDTSTTEKSKVEASPKLEKKGKPLKATEKKDVEKNELKVAKVDAKVINTAIIENHVANKEEIVNLVSSVDEKSSYEVPEEQLSDKKSEVSALTSPVEETSDQLISSKKQDLQSAAALVREDEEKFFKKPELKDEEEPFDAKEEVVASEAIADVQSVVGVEDKEQVDVELVEDIDAQMDDLDEDSLGNETEKDHLDVEIDLIETVAVEEEDDDMDETNLDVEPDHSTILEPSRHIIDEMVRSGISLAESAGTESAPNENLYSQDLGEESPLEEEDVNVHQMEKTLLHSKEFGLDEIKVDFKSELASPMEQDSTEEGEMGEECIEKDVMEELEKEIDLKGEDLSKEVVCLVEGEHRRDDVDASIPAEEHQNKQIKCNSVSFNQQDHQEDETCNSESFNQQDETLVGDEIDDGEQILVDKEHFESSEPVSDVPELSPEEVGSEFLPRVIKEVEQMTENIKDLLDGGIDVSEIDVHVAGSSPLKAEHLPEDGNKLERGIETSENVCDVDVHKAGEFDELAVTDKKESVSNVEKSEEVDQKQNIEINLDYFADESDVTIDGKSCIQGFGDVELRDQLAEEKSPMSDDQVFDLKSKEGFGDLDSLINFEVLDDTLGISMLKKDSGMDDLAAICGEIPSYGSDNFTSSSADSTVAVAGSISEPQLSSDCDDDNKFAKGDFNQFCGEIADHLNIIKEHRDAVQKELLAANEKDVVFYNKNVAFHKEHADDLSEEDELETISEHPEIEEEEEFLMNKTTDASHDAQQKDQHLAEDETNHQLIDFNELLASSNSKGFPSPCTDGVSLDTDASKVDPSGKTMEDLSPGFAPAIHSSSTIDELVTAWGEPMNLPSPEKPKKLTLKKEGTTQETVPPVAVPIVADHAAPAAKKKVSLGSAKPIAPNETSGKNVRTGHKVKSAADERKKPDPIQKPMSISHPFYTDVAFVYEKDDERHCTYNADFFKKVRSNYYILSSACPTILDHLLEAKQTWDNTEVPTVTIVSKMDWLKVKVWVISKEALLKKLKVTVLPNVDETISDLHLHTI